MKKSNKKAIREYSVPQTRVLGMNLARNFCESGYGASTEEYSESEYDLIGF